MQQRKTHGPVAGRRSWVAVAPGVGLAILAKFSCSMCLTIYAGVLSSVGLGFVATDGGFLGLTAFFLALGTAGIAWSGRRHRDWGPLLLALAGALLLIVGRVEVVAPAVYVGTGAFTGAALWNLWLGLRSPRQLVSLSAREKFDNRPPQIS